MPDIDPVMMMAARLRVEGKSWEEVAEAIDRAADTMRHWKYKRSDEWNRALVKAVDDALPTYENEALLVCRQHLRDPEKAAGATKTLLRHCRELRGTLAKVELSGRGGGPLKVLLEMSDEELDALANDQAEG